MTRTVFSALCNTLSATENDEYLTSHPDYGNSRYSKFVASIVFPVCNVDLLYCTSELIDYFSSSNLVNCWDIYPDSSLTSRRGAIEIRFTNFQLEYQSACFYDRVVVYCRTRKFFLNASSEKRSILINLPFGVYVLNK